MGSYGKAIMSGFICRLCSERKQNVLHIYSAKAHECELIKKLSLLPINIDKYDNLPKTICQDCIGKLNTQYDLIQRINKCTYFEQMHRAYHGEEPCTIRCPLYGRTLSNTTCAELTQNESDVNKANN